MMIERIQSAWDREHKDWMLNQWWKSVFFLSKVSLNPNKLLALLFSIWEAQSQENLSVLHIPWYR